MKQELTKKEKKIVTLLQLIFVLQIITSPITIAPIAIGLFDFNQSHVPYCATATCEESSCQTDREKTTCKKCSSYDEKGIEVWTGECTYVNGDGEVHSD